MIVGGILQLNPRYANPIVKLFIVLLEQQKHPNSVPENKQLASLFPKYSTNTVRQRKRNFAIINPISLSGI